jgi:hypothetical protein
MTLKQAAQQALDVQSACNLRAVLGAYLRVWEAIRDAQPTSGPALWVVPTHPILQLFAVQVAHLTCSGATIDGAGLDYFRAHDWCERTAKGEEVPLPCAR